MYSRAMQRLRLLLLENLVEKQLSAFKNILSETQCEQG
jgi:hypothetical protein